MFLALLSFAHATDYSGYWAALDDQAGWEALGTKQTAELGAVSIRQKVILGQDCLEGSGDTSAQASTLLSFAADIPNQPGWSTAPVTTSANLTPAGDSFDYYQVLDLPRPLSDRYWFVHADIVRAPVVLRFRWEEIDPAALYPEVLATILAKTPGAVRTKVNVGDWTFSSGAGTTHIRYRICTDVGGAIPDWAGEYAARSTLPNNLADIVRAAQKHG